VTRPLGPALAILVAVAAGPAFGQGTAAQQGTAMPAAGSNASAAYHDAMTAVDQKMAGMRVTGDPSVDFARMMIPHHQAAIDMAEAYLRDGHDPQLRAMSQRIVTSQRKEIGTLEAWLAKHRKP